MRSSGGGPGSTSAVDALAGRSPAWQRAVAAARRHGGFRLPLVVRGEEGSGKLTLLRALWSDATRDGPLEVLDAATLPLEGCGAFLGRVRSALSRPDARPAPGGLVVLRHVELLDTRTALAVGALLDAHLDPAAAPDPARGPAPGPMVAVAGTMVVDAHDLRPLASQPLLDRLGVVTVSVPPLRARAEDVALLVASIMRSIGSTRRWRPDALAALSRAEWRGNVRQLRNVVVGCALGGGCGDIGPSELPADLRAAATVGRVLTPIEQLEMAAIVAGLRDSGGNKALTAAELGISRSTLYRKLRAYGIDADA
jgi:DNA-binding NtrC family response regulator